jgi:hypothetical protein
MQALRKMAMRCPQAEEGIACKGTALECRTIKARNKAFLRKTELRLKLGDSLAEAAKLAAKEPDRYQAGPGGWVKVTFSAAQPPPLDVLKRWIDESYRLLAPKQLVAMVGDGKIASTRKVQKKTIKKR